MSRTVSREKSFAQWAINEYGKDFFQLYWDYEKNNEDPWTIGSKGDKRVWLKCQKSKDHPSYDISCWNAHTQGCPYCSGRRVYSGNSLAEKYPHVSLVWSDKNDFSPEVCAPRTQTGAWWKCPGGFHEDFYREISTSTSLDYRCPKCSDIVRCNNRSKIFTQSFYDKCIEKNATEILELWDYDKNIISPKDIGFSAGKTFSFKCPRGLHESTQYRLNWIWIKHEDFLYHPCSKCNSFGQWGEDTFGLDFLEKYWDYNLNMEDPWGASKRTQKKVWIKCDKTPKHGSYEISCSNFVAGKRCPYCAGKKVFPGESLADKFPESIDLWSENNSATPFNYLPSSGKMVWWKCNLDKHDDYIRAVYHATSRNKFMCPKCIEEQKSSSLQNRVKCFLESTRYTILHEYSCTIVPVNPLTNAKLRFDNEVLELKLLCEVHGQQHYHKHTWFSKKLSEEEQERNLRELQDRDRFKKEYAISKGYRYLELPYYSIDNGSYTKLIQDAIEQAEKELAG